MDEPMSAEDSKPGPLAGLRFIEMAGIGPAPFACMVLADLGATGIRIESPRPGISLGAPQRDITRRGRPSVVVDLAQPAGVKLLLQLVSQADVLVEGFRPGVMERLGAGPTECLARQPRLVYGRMTGWGQEGPFARVAGHDLTYLAAAGVLAHVGRRGQPPTPPLNLVADYGGGAMLLLVGLLAALWESRASGQGQVVDAAMIDGAALLMSMYHSLSDQDLWSTERGVNLLDSGAPFYDVYRTADDGWLAVACLEPAFYQSWLEVAGLAERGLPEQFDVAQWPVLRKAFEQAVASKGRADWAELLAGADACAEVVLSMTEAASHPQLAARATMVTHDGLLQAAAAPRFSRTPAATSLHMSSTDGSVFEAWGLAPDAIVDLRAAGVISG